MLALIKDKPKPIPKIIAGKTAEIPPGKMIKVSIDGRDILVANIDGKTRKKLVSETAEVQSIAGGQNGSRGRDRVFRPFTARALSSWRITRNVGARHA